jgi:hypothetical protein
MGPRLAIFVATLSVPHLLRESAMFLTIAIVLLVLWALGIFVFPVVGGLVHILLIIAVIAIIWHFLKASRTRV